MKERSIIVAMTIEISEAYQKDRVKNAVAKELADIDQTNVSGASLYLSDITARVLRVNGVKSVEVTKFKHADSSDDSELATGVIHIEPFEKVKTELFLVLK